MIKLNLGCGDKKIHGFVNIDGRIDCNPDVVGDITNLQSIGYDNNVDLIYACHVLEHFPFKSTTNLKKTYFDLLQSWYKALKPTYGILRISVPDIEAIFKYYFLKNNKNIMKDIRTLLWGGEKHDYDLHYNGWDFQSLKNDLETVGFKFVERYDWRETEHSYVDDYSQAFLPHMDKNNGYLMSLNVHAVKVKI